MPSPLKTADGNSPVGGLLYNEAMNRYSYTNGYIAPRHIFVGDIYSLLGTNLYCRVVSTGWMAGEDGIKKHRVGYIMYERFPRNEEADVTYLTPEEFLEKFEFYDDNSDLPRMQQERDEYDNEERFEYWDDEYFDEDGYE